MGKLEGKVAIVTGGTRGIGFGIVEKFLAEGAKVALFGSRQETVDAALEKIKQNDPEAPVMGLHPALTDPDEIAAAFKSVGRYVRFTRHPGEQCWHRFTHQAGGLHARRVPEGHAPQR